LQGGLDEAKQVSGCCDCSHQSRVKPINNNNSADLGCATSQQPDTKLAASFSEVSFFLY